MKITPTKILHYGLLLTAAYIIYTWFVQEDTKDSFANHPRNKEKFKDKENEAKGQGHKYAEDARHVQFKEEKVKGDVKDKTRIKHENNAKPKSEKHVNPKDNTHKQAQAEKDKDHSKINIDEKQPRKKPPEEKKHQTGGVKKQIIDPPIDEDFPKVGKIKWKKNEPESKDFLMEMNKVLLEGGPNAEKMIHNLSDHIVVKIPNMKKPFGEEHDDLAMAEEKKRRRKLFFEKIAKKESKDLMDEDLHIHERENNFVFVTAANSKTFVGTVSFIYSVQQNFPKAKIGIFDIGLTEKEEEFLDTICSVEVVPNLMGVFPEHITRDATEMFWRPIILHHAGGRYGHFVYVNPMRMFKDRVDLKGHFDLSRKGGVAMFGSFKSYSTAVVTHPDMFYYLAVDVRKLFTLQHMEIHMMIVHNSEHLDHYFYRWLVQCAMEEYCIAPPGAQRRCNMNLYPKSKKYADCHRYDESAINIILASWHKYDVDHYAAHDLVTQYYDGFDRSSEVKMCPLLAKEGL